MAQAAVDAFRAEYNTGAVALADRKIRAGLTGDAYRRVPPLVASSVGVRRVPVPGRGDRGCGALVLAQRPVLSRRRGAAGRTRHRGGPRDCVPVGAAIHAAAGRRRPVLPPRAGGDRWFVDETYVKVGGLWRYVYRAIDQHVQQRRTRRQLHQQPGWDGVELADMTERERAKKRSQRRRRCRRLEAGSRWRPRQDAR
jgi:hypothetical protein